MEATETVPTPEGSNGPINDAKLEECVVYAGFWPRMGALIIDQIIIVLIMAAFYAIASVDHSDHTPDDAIVVFTAISFVYYIVSECSKWQATPGKKMLNMHVIDLSGQRITFTAAAKRFFFRYFSAFILGIGFLLAFFTEHKQTLHDLVAHTVVLEVVHGIPVEPAANA